MKKYNIGIIGYGGFGKFLHHWWSRLDSVTVSAIADHGADLEDSQHCRYYRDWKELISDPNIDIVSIVTPPETHAEMACAAMQSGKHVLLEKPIAISEEEARRIIHVQQETGMVITVDHMIRYNPIIQVFMNFGFYNSFGRLRHAVVSNYAQDESLPSDHWFWDEKISGGIMVEHGVHFFDIINALGRQKFTKIFGVSDNRNVKQRDRVAALVQYDGGLTASYYHSFSGPGFFEQTTINLTYDLARIQIEGWMPMKGKIKAIVNESIREQLKNIPGWSETAVEKLHETSDASRPDGWGATEAEGASGKKEIYIAGLPYQAEQLVIVEGNFGISQTKGEVYGSCVQLILSDIIQKIENKDHELAITIQDAFEALQTAVIASK